jgi:ribosomal protein S18 acetylase RimI-like enzyme
MGIMQSTLRIATVGDLEELLPMVERYNEAEEIISSLGQKRDALSALLREPSYGFVWLILCGETTIGYIAVCFCYSIEIGGFDSFIDEFFIEEEHRARGFGTNVIDLVVAELRRKGIRALSLEVARDNNPAKRFYMRCGFEPRDRYSVMTRLI